MRYDVTHTTTYTYSDAVAVSHNVGHLLPRPGERQELHRLELEIEPSPPTVRWHRDYFGNDVVYFSIREPHEKLVVTTRSRVEVAPRPKLDIEGSPPFERVADRVRSVRSDEGLAAFEMVWASPFVATGEAFAEYARRSFTPGRRLAEALLELNERMHAEFRYDPEATSLATPIGEVLEARHGVCQDFAHLMIGCLRSLGLPARYVSGYLKSADAVAARSEAEEWVGAEASHAWVSAWCPVNGWIDVDPTNDVVPSERHVTLGWGRDYDDVSPLKGVTHGGGAHDVAVEVQALPVEAGP
ncbi:MAG: transglutaminase family protein [Myxococcota bacterium]|nr:transglutaminase family protein [Myxococcota bacterium]